jgi:hypothetical protein
MRLRIRYLPLGAIAFVPFVLACRSTSEPRPPGGLSVIAGAGVTDTIEAPLPQALTVELRDDAGNPVTGVIVRFETQAPSNPLRRTEAAIHVCSVTVVTCGPPAATPAVRIDTTDDLGRAEALVRLGRVAGAAVVRLSVPSLGIVDSATYTVEPGKAVRARTPVSDTTIVIGTTALLPAGRVVDRLENTRPETTTLALQAGDRLTLGAASHTVVAQKMGIQLVNLMSGTFAEPITVRVVPPGRLVVWSSALREVRLVNTDGSQTKTLVTAANSDLGVFPRWDATRRLVSLHTSPIQVGPATLAIVVDTAGPRRDVNSAEPLSNIIAVRQMPDGTVLLVARPLETSAPVALWRVAANNAVAQVVTLPGLGTTYGGADISPDGTRVAYLATVGANLELRLFTIATGASTVLAVNARSPRWSPTGDRVAYLEVAAGVTGTDGRLVVINADGSDRRAVGNAVNFSPGLTWSPDGAYLAGRSAPLVALRIVRVSDGDDVSLRFPRVGSTTIVEDYFQPDWR